MCRSRLKAWGLSTYKKSKGETTQTASGNPSRRRKGRLTISTLSPVLKQPDVYRIPMIFINLVDQLILSLFQHDKPWSTHQHLFRPKIPDEVSVDDYIQWEKVADLYNSALINFKSLSTKKLRASLYDARLQLRLLMPSPASLTPKEQPFHHLVMVTSFWRICHRILELDSFWLQHQYSFLFDFVLEFEKIAFNHYGKYHPLRRLLFMLANQTKADMKHFLRIGASRTVDFMMPKIEQKKRAVVIWYWTTA